MGQITEINGGTPEISVAHRRRFARYFPGLFAYVRAMSDGYSTGVDKVVSAFEMALSEPHADENAFVFSLFGINNYHNLSISNYLNCFFDQRKFISHCAGVLVH